jgi:Rrf2 family transcriptional regulator, cysteine metabolism repressor
MVDLAKGYPDMSIALREVAKRQSISMKYLEHVVASLKSAGLVRAIRGPQGGYILTRPPREIVLAEIFNLLEGRPVLADCFTEAGCARESICPTSDLWHEITDAIEQILQNTTLQDLLDREAEKLGRLAPDYMI